MWAFLIRFWEGKKMNKLNVLNDLVSIRSDKDCEEILTKSFNTFNLFIFFPSQNRIKKAHISFFQ